MFNVQRPTSRTASANVPLALFRLSSTFGLFYGFLETFRAFETF